MHVHMQVSCLVIQHQSEQPQSVSNHNLLNNTKNNNDRNLRMHTSLRRHSHSPPAAGICSFLLKSISIQFFDDLILKLQSFKGNFFFCSAHQDVPLLPQFPSLCLVQADFNSKQMKHAHLAHSKRCSVYSHLCSLCYPLGSLPSAFRNSATQR